MRKVLVISLAILISGCATWSSSNVKAVDGSPKASVTGTQVILPEQVLITENDITNREYRVLGDISVTVNKTTLFNKDPTREMVEAELKIKAAELGANAIIFVRYGTVGISFMSWGALNGKGRAVVYTD